MRSLKTKVIIPLLLVALVGIASSFMGLISLKQLGTAGNEIAAQRVPLIITLDAISSNVQQMQQLLLTHSVMDTKEDKQRVEEQISVSAATLRAYWKRLKKLLMMKILIRNLHSETSGDFTPVYAYENPFHGKDTSQGAIIEFYANPTWDVHVLGTIFAINGSGAYDGKLYFTPGSYLGYNSAGFGGFYDANLFNYNIVTDYIKDGALIRIELLPNGFAVYANDILCYDQTILNNPEAADGDFTAESDFSPVLTWLSGAEALYFGYGSWWNTVSDAANIELSRISFRLPDGTVLMDQLQADKDLVESLGGSVAAASTETQTELKLADVEVAVFDIHSVEYQGESVLPYMTAAVIIVILGALVTVILVCRQRTYE